LTKHEEKTLDGEYGEARATAMRLLCALGEIYGAKRLIPVKSCHVSGVSYKTIGDMGLEFLRQMVEEGASFTVKTTVNPCGIDLEDWEKIGFPREFAKKQLEIVDCFRAMGVSRSYSCTPYLIGNRPRPGEHVAWSESSAIAFANSILGARTNREGGPSALASAIIGKTPYYGLHITENREPTHMVSVKCKVENDLKVSLLGYAVGRKLGQAIPYIGKVRLTQDLLKALAASMASSSSISMFYAEGSYEAKKIGEKKLKKLEKLEVDDHTLRKTFEELSIQQEASTICLGCPHLSLNELKQICKVAAGHRGERRLLCFTSYQTFLKAEKTGLVRKIQKIGGTIVKDTCMVVSPLTEIGVHSIETNSCKASYYAPLLSGVKVKLNSLEDIFS
jgi:hypothetical protein